MAQSQYLLQALQALGAQPGGGASMPDMAALQAQGQMPHQSIGQNLRQAGQNVMGVPGRLGAVPGNVMHKLSGLFGLGGAANPSAITSQQLPPARPYQ